MSQRRRNGNQIDGQSPPPPQHPFRIVAFGVLGSVLLGAVLLSATVVGSDRQASDPAAPVTLPELAAWFRAQHGQWQIGAANNIAIIPGTDDVAVRVNTVHGGLVGSHSPTNALYYVDNHDPYDSSAPPYSMGEPVFSVQYDGMTVLLEAEASITANVTNHVKIAIADYTDWLYDSAVFLEVWSASQCQ